MFSNKLLQIELLFLQVLLKHNVVGKVKKAKIDGNKINLKRDLIKKIGQCKQCQLCKKLFSSEYKAIDHILEVHGNVQYEDVQQIGGKMQTCKRKRSK